MRIRTALGVIPGDSGCGRDNIVPNFSFSFPSICFWWWWWWWGTMRFLVEREREGIGIGKWRRRRRKKERKEGRKEERKYTNRFRDGSRESIISLSLHLYNSICFFPLGDGELEKQAEEVDAALPHP
jgi:hypothetical protein